jgi:hypothetical protein
MTMMGNNENGNKMMGTTILDNAKDKKWGMIRDVKDYNNR